MKTLLSIALAFACLGLGYSLGKRDQLEKNRAEIATFAKDYAECIKQREAQKAHFSQCSWISSSQIVSVKGDRGHWLQLDLKGPGYNH
jgi:hypothetical protein